MGKALSLRLGLAHFDTDDFYWLPTNPPFRLKREPGERVVMLLNAFERAALTGWVLSGSLISWGSALIGYFDLVIYLHADTALRVGRIRRREDLRFGTESNAPGDGGMTSMRNL